MTLTTSVPSATRLDTRETRALELFRSRGHEIGRVSRDVYLVPSCSGRHRYTVDYAEETCSCPDHRGRRVNCLHILAVGVLVSKRRAARARTSACDGCGRRCRRSELVELVEGEHDGLTHFDGELLCPACAAGVA